MGKIDLVIFIHLFYYKTNNLIFHRWNIYSKPRGLKGVALFKDTMLHE